MTLKAQLQADLTMAMKARDAVTTGTLRMVLTAIGVAEVAGDTAVELTDDQVLGVLQSEAKKRTEAVEIYRSAGRPELADKEAAELAVIEAYLPAALSDAELHTLVDAAVAEHGPNLGAVIKAVRSQAGAAADGSKIAAMVKAALA